MAKKPMTPKAFVRIKSALEKQKDGVVQLKNFIARVEPTVVKNSKSGKTSK